MTANDKRIIWAIFTLCLTSTTMGLDTLTSAGLDSDTLTGAGFDQDTLMSMGLGLDTLTSTEPDHNTPTVWWGKQIVTATNRTLWPVSILQPADPMSLSI